MMQKLTLRNFAEKVNQTTDREVAELPASAPEFLTAPPLQLSRWQRFRAALSEAGHRIKIAALVLYHGQRFEDGDL